MRLDSYSIRNFVANYTNFDDLDLGLNALALRYKQSRNPRDFATILNKVLGVILKYGRGSFTNLGLTEDDIYSHGMHALFNALEGWGPDKNVAFLTYFYRMVHNAIITLQNAKAQRNYRDFHSSLDEMLDNPDSNFDVDDSYNFSRQIRSRRLTNKESVELLISIPQEKIVDMAYNLGISTSKLQLALLAAKSRYKLTTQEEEQKVRESKKEWRQLKKKLKLLV